MKVLWVKKRWVKFFSFSVLTVLVVGAGIKYRTYLEKKNYGLNGFKLQAPEIGLYQAAYPDIPDASAPKGPINDYEKLIGKKLAWATLMNDFTEGPTFPRAMVEETLAAGTIPYIRILPRSKRVQGEGPEPVYTLEFFTEGKFDTEIRNWCKEAASIKRPLLVEFAQEPNGDWYGWGGFWHGASQHTYSNAIPDGPYLYREASRRFIKLCREEKANNLTWFFHVDSQPKPQQDWNKMAYYYPGDEYIDWIGLSVYGAQYPTDYWGSFEETLAPAYQELDAMPSARPMAILEMGVIENPKDPNGKAEWLKDALAVLRSGKYPRVKAINYWHERSWLPKGDNNFRVDSSPAAFQSFLSEISRPEFVATPVFK